MIDEYVYNRKVQAVLSMVENGPTLDCGCGDMRYTRMIEHATGIDMNPEFEGTVNKPDMIMSATDLKFGDGTFSNILFLDVLEHIPNCGKAVAEAHRVLRSGGVCVVVDPNDLMLFITRIVTLRVREALRGNPDHIHRFSRGDVKKLMSSHGFRLERKTEMLFATAYKFRKCH